MNASGLGHGRDVDLTMLIVVSLVTELKTLPAIFRILAPSKGSCLLEVIMDMAIPLDLSESRQISTTYQKKEKKNISKFLDPHLLISFLHFRSGQSPLTGYSPGR